ncbi:hypothetical protein J3R83DRAFT_1794 [Lanmaoa asiatica]|nr:hypothetical protein J3R83DRAFT_1794 [Lanmaoa asiatica]
MSPTVISHSLQPRRGFHSTLSTIIALDPPDSNCSFFALYTFPQSIITDRYQLIDRRLSFEFWGESNLELPVFALNQTANSLLLINATSADARSKQVTVDVPVHARYGEPGMAQTSPQSITISSPTCFWACPHSASVSSALSSTSPVVNSIMLVPVASKCNLVPVEMGTATVILVAFLWLVYRSWRVATMLQSCHLKKQ